MPITGEPYPTATGEGGKGPGGCGGRVQPLNVTFHYEKGFLWFYLLIRLCQEHKYLAWC